MNGPISIPLTIYHLWDQLNQSRFKENEEIQYCDVGLPGEKCLIFFQKSAMLELHHTTRKVVSSTICRIRRGQTSGYIYQLFCYFNNSNQIVPLVQILMMNVNYDSFRNVFYKLHQEYPYFKPSIAYLTLLKNEQVAWSEVFKCLIREKFTDYFLEIKLSIEKLGTTIVCHENSASRWLLRSLLSLPLLPKSFIETGFSTIVQKAQKSGVLVELAPVLLRVYHKWIRSNRLKRLSLYNANYRANNAAMIVNNILTTSLKYCTDANQFKESLRVTAAALKHTSVHNLRHDKPVKRCTKAILSKKMSIRRFLRVTSTRVLNVFYATLRVPVQ